MTQLGYREVYALILEALGKEASQPGPMSAAGFHSLAESVIGISLAKGLIATPSGGLVVNGRRTSPDMERVRELVRQAMWGLLAKGILVFGLNETNPNWPWYRLTEFGKDVVKATAPQPYDPDGFIAYFRRNTGAVDPTVEAYLIEAVRTYNSGCNRAAAVMLGGASEKMLLVLCDAFEAAINDATKLVRFQSKLGKRAPASHRYNVLLAHLRLMIDRGKLPAEHAETADNALRHGFDLLRRCRNAGGHPDVPGDIDEETLFMNLRFFTEYARRVNDLIAYFKNNPADW